MWVDKYVVKSLFVVAIHSCCFSQTTSIIIYSIHGNQTASELRRERCLSLKHQRVYLSPASALH